MAFREQPLGERLPYPRRRQLAPAIEYVVHQGIEIGRPSTLFVKASLEAGIYDLRVGGKVRPVARCEWL